MKNPLCTLVDNNTDRNDKSSYTAIITVSTAVNKCCDIMVSHCRLSIVLNGDSGEVPSGG